jgi:hypothetical protein
MVKKDNPPIPKESSEKSNIDCPHCFAHISHAEVTEERHGVRTSAERLNTISIRITTALHDTFARNARKR